MKTTHHEKKFVLSAFIVPIGIIGIFLFSLSLFSSIALAEGLTKSSGTKETKPAAKSNKSKKGVSHQESTAKVKKPAIKKNDPLKVQVHKKMKAIPKETLKIVKSKANAIVKPVAKSKTIQKPKLPPPAVSKAKPQPKSIEPEKVLSKVAIPTVPAVEILKPQEIIESTSQSFIKIYAQSLDEKYDVMAYPLDSQYWITSLSQIKFTQGEIFFKDTQGRSLSLISFDIENGLALLGLTKEIKSKLPSYFKDLVKKAPGVGTSLIAVSKNERSAVEIHRGLVGGTPLQTEGKYLLKVSFEDLAPGFYIVKSNEGSIVGFINALRNNPDNSKKVKRAELTYVYVLTKLLKKAEQLQKMGVQNVEHEIISEMEAYKSASNLFKSQSCTPFKFPYSNDLVMKLGSPKGFECFNKEKLEIDDEINFRSFYTLEIEGSLTEALSPKDRSVLTQVLLSELRQKVEKQFLNYTRHDLPICDRGWLQDKGSAETFYQLCTSRIKGTQFLNSTYMILEDLEKKNKYSLRTIFIDGVNLELSQYLLGNFLKAHFEGVK